MTYSNSGYKGDRVQSTVEKITARDRIRTENIIRYINMGERIEIAIKNIKDDIERELLEVRYLDGNTVEKTAEIMEYTTRYTYTMINNALLKLSL